MGKLIRVKDLCIGDTITWYGCKAKIAGTAVKSWGYWHVPAELDQQGPVDPFPSDWVVDNTPYLTTLKYNDNDVMDYVVRGGKVIQDARLECPQCQQKCQRREYGDQVYAFCSVHNKFDVPFNEED